MVLTACFGRGSHLHPLCKIMPNPTNCPFKSMVDLISGALSKGRRQICGVVKGLTGDSKNVFC